MDEEESRIACGGSHTLTVDHDGHVWVFGNNLNGELGVEGEETYSYSPQQLDFPVPILVVSCGYYHSICIDSSDNVWSFGRNVHGQLGHGDRSQRSTPTKIPNLNALRVSCGLHHTICLGRENNAWAFGKNNNGQLGVENCKIDQLIPTAVCLAEPISSVACGLEHSVFLDISGRVYGCGENMTGQLGPKKKAKKGKMIHISSLKNITSIACGGFNTVALDVNFKLYILGSPLEHSAVSDVPFTQMSSGFSHVMAVDTDGLLWVYGNNRGGQCGLGSLRIASRIQQVPGISNIAYISRGGNHTIIKDTDGNTWCMGENSKGQLGMVPEGNINTPSPFPHAHIIGSREHNRMRTKSARK